MSTGPKQKADNRGGYRPGAGRKPGSRETLSVRQIKEMREAAEARAKKEGKTIFDVLLDFIYGDEGTKERLAAAKLYLDKMMITVSEGGEADKAAGPAVFLPEHRPQLESVKEDKAA